METSILIFLGIAMALVALLGKMRISAAFLLAGVLVGPHALGLYRVSGIWNHLADLGIMFLWFGLGLEQNIRRLWSMRRAIFGLGAAQVLCVAALLFPLVFFTAHWTEMCVAMTCLILAISNSGADLQMLADRNELSTKLGRQTYSVLLFQNLLAVPLLAMLPVFAAKSLNLGAEIIDVSVMTIALIAGGAAASRLILNPVLKLVAKTKSRELFLMTALAATILCEAGLRLAGLPVGVGAFLAGLLFSDGLYSHQTKADISPYQIMFASFFFITLGMGLDVAALADKKWVILGGTAAFMAVKFAAIYAVARLRGTLPRGAFLMSAILAQGGEIGLLMLQTMKMSGIESIPPQHTEILSAIIILSMMATPVIVRICDKMEGRIYSPKKARTLNSAAPKHAPTVVICGFGRVGKTIARMLALENMPYAALDMNADNVVSGQAAGFNVFYGDTTKGDVLANFGITPRGAKVVVLALDNASVAKKTVRAIKRIAPRIKIFARARNIHESEILISEGAKIALPETIESAFMLGRGALSELGISDRGITGVLSKMRRDNYKAIAGHQ